MASDALAQQVHQNDKRITALEAERPHLATKADLERQTRLLVMWLVLVGVTLAGMFAAGFLYIIERLP